MSAHLHTEPFACRAPIEKDLDRLVTEGVLEPMSISKWAAPTFAVPKPGGRIHICAHFSTGLNQALDINQYLLSRPTELIVALNGGTQFSKTDFLEALFQVALDKKSKELLVINAHKNLFRFNRLPFGNASAPSILQKIIDQMLAGLEGTVCYLDDIIITGNNTANHLKNLQKALKRTHEWCFHINNTNVRFYKIPSICQNRQLFHTFDCF